MNDKPTRSGRHDLGVFVGIEGPGERRNDRSALHSYGCCGFCKHTLFAVPCCAFLWLLNADWRLALRGGIAGGAAAIGGLVICSAFYGPAFFEQLTMPRIMHAHRLVAGFGRLQWIIPAFIIWAVWAWDRRRTEQARFTVLFVILGYLIMLCNNLETE